MIFVNVGARALRPRLCRASQEVDYLTSSGMMEVDFACPST